MRKCSYCEMVSNSMEVCDWCKRPFDTFIFAREQAKPAKKGLSKKQALQLRIGITAAAIVIALLSFAIQRRSAAPTTLPSEQVTVANLPKGNVSTKQAASGVRVDTQKASGLEALTGTKWSSSPFASGASNQSPTGSTGSTEAAGKDQVHIKDLHLNFEPGASSTETAFGKITIENLGDSAITDFRMVINVNGVLSPLVPFEGDVHYPMALPQSSKRIPPHGSMTVPVMTPGHYVATKNSMKTVMLEALPEGSDGSILRDQSPIR